MLEMFKAECEHSVEENRLFEIELDICESCSLASRAFR
jgi:hypothetical protein